MDVLLPAARHKLSRNAACTVLLLLAAAGLAFAFPVPEEPWGHDGAIHAANVSMLACAIHSGDWLPRWLPELNGGLGGPNFRYYSFFAYYVPAFFHEIGEASLIEALRGTCRLYFAIGFLGAGILARRLFGRGAAFVAPLLFSFSPYALVLVQARLALPEYAAMNLAPWALFSLVCWRRSGKQLTALLVSVQVAVLLCLHNLAAILWLPFILFLGAAPCRGTWSITRAFSSAGLVAAGVLLAAFQFGPSLLELGWIDASRQLGNMERFSRWALPASALLSNRPEEGFSAHLVPGSFAVVVLFVALLCLLAPAFRRNGRPTAGGDFGPFVFLALASLILTTQASRFVAVVVPPLTYIQFPWRFLGPLALFTGVVGGGLVRALSPPLKAGVWAALLIMAWGLFVPSYGKPIRSVYPVETLQDFRQHVFTGDFENKYLPLGARVLPAPRSQAVVLPAQASLLEMREDRSSLMVRMISPDRSRVLVKWYWFAGWHAEVDGREVCVDRDPLNGEVTVTVPAGEHTLRVRRGTRTLGWLYALVSLTALFACSLGLLTRQYCLLGWLPCALAIGATLWFGMVSGEGFNPPLTLQRGMRTDCIVKKRISRGWSVVHYETGLVGAAEGRRGFASVLNLGPGGSLRRGTGVWAAELTLPSGYEVALQCAGRVLLIVNGRSVTGKGMHEGELDGLRLLRFPPRLFERKDGGRVRLVVVAFEIEGAARARLLARKEEERGRWRLVRTAWLQPAENRGYREFFGGAPLRGDGERRP